MPNIFSSSVRLLHPLASLWPTRQTDDNSREICSDVDLHPRPVLLHLPQHHQDGSHIQGGHFPFMIFKAMDKKISLFQPTEFNQLEHEKRFKLVFKGLMIVITLCVGLFFVLLHFLEPGSLSKWGAMQTSGVVAAGEDNGIKTMFPLLIVDVFWGLTALVMAISDVFARVMMPAPTVIHPLDCSVGFFTNNIPFLTLNFSIVIGIFVNMVMIHLFNAFGAHGVQISAILTVFLVTNKKARNHVKLRLQQKFDSFTVGAGTNLVHPSGWTNSVPPPLGSNNPLHPVVSVALVPLRDQIWEFSLP